MRQYDLRQFFIDFLFYRQGQKFHNELNNQVNQLLAAGNKFVNDRSIERDGIVRYIS